jgi:cytochrome c oxidase cbb3-type subunit 1
MNATPCTTSCATGSDSISTTEIDASCRMPLFVLFTSAAAWLMISSVFGLIASLKFHSPNFLADCAWFTYGRVHAVSTNALLYGFALQAGLGVALWIFARVGQTTVAQPWLIGFSGKLWNLGVLIGVWGILTGESTGFENLEMPRYAAVILFVAYLMIGFWSVLTLHKRANRSLEPSQWFLLAALFWFPWIFSTANLLLTVCPVRGVTQSVINWWFSANLNFVWLGLVGLGAQFYFLPKLTNRPLYSQYLALFTFWTLILFASWSGIPQSAPVPAWMPVLSTVATVLTLTTVLSFMVNVYQTVGCGCSHQTENLAAGKFIAFGAMAFVVAWLMNIADAVPQISAFTHFTWFTVAQSQLNIFGFFAMTMIGAIYYIIPRVAGIDWPCHNSVRRHYWLAAIGTILFALPLAIGGVLQGIKLNSGTDFLKVTHDTLMFLRVSTLGEVLILIGNLLLLLNLLGLWARYSKTRVAPFYKDVTTELKPAEVKL